MLQILLRFGGFNHKIGLSVLKFNVHIFYVWYNYISGVMFRLDPPLFLWVVRDYF